MLYAYTYVASSSFPIKGTLDVQILSHSRFISPFHPFLSLPPRFYNDGKQQL